MRQRELNKMIKEWSITLKALPESQRETALTGLLAELSDSQANYSLKVVKAGFCEVCGKPLEKPKRRGSIRFFCSLACKQKAYREKIKAEKGI